MYKELRIIQFRLTQFYRMLRNIGLIYILLILPFVFILLLSFMESVSKMESKNALVAIYCLLPILFHSRRRDTFFLNKISVKKAILFVLEYSLVSLPFSFVLIFLKAYGQVAFGHLLVIVLAILLSKKSFSFEGKKQNWSLHFIPDYFFEWKTSIRKYNYVFLFTWILGLVCAMDQFIYFIFILLFASFISANFKPVEGKELKPANFKEITEKAVRNSVFIVILLIPHLIVYLVFNPSYWYIIIGIFVYFIIFQLYCIFYKYANYTQRREISNEIPTAIFMLLCPFLPVSLFLLIYTANRARKKLRYV